MSKFDINDIKTVVTTCVKNHFNAEITDIASCGDGAQGSVFKVNINKEPNVIAVKMVNNIELVKSEVKLIEFISSKIDIKLPKVYHYDISSKIPFIVMQYIDGVSAKENKFLRKNKQIKQSFANQTIDNLINLQSVTNDKFGNIDNAIFDTWEDYYKKFATYVIEFTIKEFESRKISKFVYSIMKKAYDKFDIIFDEKVESACLTHGDYWLPNILVDDNMNLVGVVDPFNVLWADKEYELFALVVGNGNKYNLLDTYKSKVKTSKKCDLKIEFYALFSEMYWYSITGNKFDSFLKFKAKQLKKQLKKFMLFN